MENDAYSKMRSHLLLRLRKTVVIFLVGAALLGILGVRISWPEKAQAELPWTTVAASAPQDEISRLNQIFTTLAETMSPSVVSIFTKSGTSIGEPLPGGDDLEFFFGHPFRGRPGFGSGLRPESKGLGSGFIINSDGYIVTNAHVVRMAGHNADEIMVKFSAEDSDENAKGHAAKIVGIDEATDVALLKLVEKPPGLRVAPLGNSDHSKVGEWVVAIGSPYGRANTITQGIVSALGRSLEGNGGGSFIQTSAGINPGNSGGPLINLTGEVIGINTAIDPRAQGIGFAIPINEAKSIISQLMKSGRVNRGWMGLAIQDVNEDIAGVMRLKSAGGVLVKEVISNQPAAKAGLEAYDIIRKIDDREVRNSRDLIKAVETLPIGRTARVEVLRGSKVKIFTVDIGEQPPRS
jgi:serine protease Do